MKGKRAQARTDVLLSAYLDGELSTREQDLLESRLATDPELRARLEELRRTVSLVRDLPQVQAPRNFLLTPSMVSRTRPRPAPRRWLAPALTFATAASALSCVAVLSMGLLVGGLLGATKAPGGAAYEVAMEPTEAPVETTLEVAGEASELPGTPAIEQAPPLAATEEGVAAADEAAQTAVPSETPAARASGPAPTATPAIPEAAPEGGQEVPPAAAPTEEEGGVSFWLLAGGLALLTAGLAIAAGLAWHARRR